MTKTLLVALVVFASAESAYAGGQAGSIGVGVEQQINSGLVTGPTGGGFGLSDLSVNYDAGKFHAGGFFGYRDPNGGNAANRPVVSIGGRFYFHVASTAMADFSLGGSIGIVSAANGMNNRDTLLFLEPGFQIRAFVASNVALSFTGGIVIATADANELDLGGQFTGLAGVHYYFF